MLKASHHLVTGLKQQNSNTLSQCEKNIYRSHDLQHACESTKGCSQIASLTLCYTISIESCFLTRVPLLPIVRGLLTSVMVLVTPPTTVVTTWACWATVTAPDLCTVMMGLVVVGEDAVAVPTWAAAVFSIRVAGLLTYKQNIIYRIDL